MTKQDRRKHFNFLESFKPKLSNINLFNSMFNEAIQSRDQSIFRSELFKTIFSLNLLENLLLNYCPQIIYIIILPMNFFGCGRGKPSQSGKSVVEIYNKVAKQDQKTFALNAVKGVKNDPSLIQRMANNNPMTTIQTPQNEKLFTKLISGNLSEYIKRQILKSQYADLIQKYQNSDELWQDPDFPHNDKSWGDPKIKVVWKRLSQLLPDCKFVDQNFAPADILQGKLGNCYFLSAVAGLAEKPYRIKKIFPNYDINKNGIYMARLLHKGIYREVVVDDYVPCTLDGQFYGAQPAGGNQIWVMILEKCWAKLFGSYEAIDGGLPHEVLRAFSSAPTFNYRVSRDQEVLQTLWGKIYEADQRNQIICCGTQPDSKSVNLESLGLVGGHAYTILGVFDSPYRMLKIRNPWGSMEWKGAASEKDKKFWSRVTPQEQLRMGFNTGEDGIFFMLWEDFQKYFVIVDICKIDDNAHYYYITDDFVKNKPNLYDFSTEGGDITITTSQTSKRQLKKIFKKEIKLANSTIILARANQQLTDFEYIASKADESYSQLYLKYKDLPKGRYVIGCYVEGESKIDSTVSVYSSSNVTLVPSTANHEDYLNQVYLDHARNNQSNMQLLSESPVEWVVFDILTDSCGFGYTAFHLDHDSSRKLGLQFDESQYEHNGLELLPPYKGSGKFKLVCDKGQELIVLCRLKVGQYLEQFTMPTPKMYRLK